jgi:hypothetical protein
VTWRNQSPPAIVEEARQRVAAYQAELGF